MQPFRTILFAADFSDQSIAAFRFACSLAAENQARLFVLHVEEPDWVPEEPPGYGQASVQFYPNAELEEHHDFLKRRLCESYAPACPIEVHYDLREGDPASAICETAEKVGADLIVMGTHGRTGFQWLLAGSVATAVMRGANCPVLALRHQALPRPDDRPPIILSPTDFSERSEATQQVARSLARDLGARLVVFHVAPMSIRMDGSFTPDIDPGFCRDALDGLRRRLDGPDLKYPVEARLGRGDAAHEILEMARELGCDLIVMGTHGRSGLCRALMGSVAEYVLTRADCPVIVVKTPQGAATPAAGRRAVATVLGVE
jgi:nucleotide-binding universal stress UspA family protein